jgi:hypothetical protein
MADLYGVRAPGDAALKLWQESLADLDSVALSTALERWPQRHSKMPTPAEIRKETMNIASAWLEAEAKRNAETADHGSVRQFVRDTAPELVQKSMHLYLSQFRPRRASANDRLIAAAVNGSYVSVEFDCRDGVVVRVERRLEPSMVMVKRAEALAGGSLSRNNPTVAAALDRVRQDDSRHYATFEDILANERAKRKQKPARFRNEFAGAEA